MGELPSPLRSRMDVAMNRFDEMAESWDTGAPPVLSRDPLCGTVSAEKNSLENFTEQDADVYQLLRPDALLR